MLTPALTFFMFTPPWFICLCRRGQKPTACLQILVYTSYMSWSLQVYVSYQPISMHICDLHVSRPGWKEVFTNFLERLHKYEWVHTSYKILPTGAIWSTVINVSMCWIHSGKNTLSEWVQWSPLDPGEHHRQETWEYVSEWRETSI